jgi:internalin A
MERDELLELIDRAAREGWTELDLQDQELTKLPPEIGQLTALRSLVLWGNRLTTLPPEIGQLTQLQSLNLYGNKLTILPPEIGQLTALRMFGLSGNDLTTLPPEIGRLTALEELYLGHFMLFDEHNDLTVLPSEIGQLTKLQRLNLSFNHLTALPTEIGRLTELQSLNLNNNRLMALPPEIFQLAALRWLGLTGNCLTTLSRKIGQLAQLRSLDLGSNDLTALPSEIGQLTKLQQLDLSHNNLTALPSEIGQLTELQQLDLSHNNLMALPPEISQLVELRELYLFRNSLTALHPEIRRLIALQELDIRENPDFSLPLEVLAKTHEPQTIIDTYLDFLAGQRRTLNEIKMIIVGQGSVGKTSLVTCLLDGPDAFDPHQTKTEGIDIHRWSLPLSTSENGQIQVNVWDFGGQEIMHATHQFFLTHRTLYLLVLNARLSEAENCLNYWLQITRSFGGDSPVILVGNKIDQQPLDIDRGGIQDKYPSIKAIVETSCLTGEGIDALEGAIAELAPTLPHVFDELLATWFDVKAELEEMDADYIPYSQYAQMCEEAGVTKGRNQRTLLGFLHDLGIVLHFPGPRLETTNILNPEWVTQGVYRILNSHALFQNEGILTWDLLAQILESPKYPRDKHI